MTLTRAQEALARPGEHVSALRDVFAGLLAQETVFRAIVEEVSDVDTCYDMGVDGPTHPLLGRWAPDLPLQTGRGPTRVRELMAAGRGVLVDIRERRGLDDIAANWAGRVEVTSARCYARPVDFDAMLIRPDGYVAWVSTPDQDTNESETTLRAALEKWFGTAGRWTGPVKTPVSAPSA